MTAQRRHALAGPEVAAPSLPTVTIEYVCDHRIGADPRERTDRIDGLRCRVSAVLSAAAAWHPNFGMYTADPVDHQHNFRSCGVEINDDLMDQ